MKMWMTTVVAALAILSTVPAEAQFGGKLIIEPVLGFGFFGGLPVDAIQLDHGISYGGRATYHVTSRWAAYGTFQRSNTGIVNAGLERGLKVDHWSAGVEYSYVPRGGSGEWRPILLEAGVGQARYQEGPNDLALNLGAGSWVYAADGIGLSFGVNDYISSYDGAGIVHQVFARFGIELAL